MAKHTTCDQCEQTVDKTTGVRLLVPGPPAVADFCDYKCLTTWALGEDQKALLNAVVEHCLDAINVVVIEHLPKDEPS